MNETFSSKNDRARAAEEIARTPVNYKVCEGCGSIVSIKAVTCPSCHAYRFEKSPDAVIQQAQRLVQSERQSVLASDLD